MARRAKYDLVKYQAGLSDKLEENDARPWFLVSQMLPPEWREVLAIWPDGLAGHASLRDGRWENRLWNAHRIVRTAPPVAWKPSFTVAHDADLRREFEPLPDPWKFGVGLTR